MQQNAEGYQEVALTSWLPKALENPQSDEWKSSHQLADLLEKQHSDPWLKDFLSTIGAADAEAVKLLSDAITANQKGLYNQALAHSRTAYKSFAKTRSTPGELRARFEEVYALRSMLLGNDCLAPVVALEKKLAPTQYHWLRAQAALEEAQCRNFRGERDGSERDTRAGRLIADQSSFPVLRLRAIGVDAGLKHLQKRCEESWQQSSLGAGLYWRGIYPLERLDQFYAVMWQCALESGYSYTAETLLHHTLEMRASPTKKMVRNEIREATLELHLSNILSAHGETALADQEREKALAKLEGVSESYAQNFILTTEFDPAEHQLQQHDAELALATLKPIGKMLDSTQDNFFALRFYRLLGNIYLQLKKFDDARAAYESAIGMAESSLRTVNSTTDRAAWIRATGDSYRGLVRVLLEQKKSAEALARWEWYRSRPLLHDSLESTAEGAWEQARLQRFNPVLPSSSGTRLIYANFEDGLQIWVYQGKRVQSKWIPIAQDQLQKRVRDFVRQCSSPGTSLDVLKESGDKLYKLLIEPVISELPQTGTLTVELDRPISDLPLGALKGPANHYIEDRYSIVYSPGVWIESNLRAALPVESNDSLLLVDDSHSPELGALPGASMEKQAISDFFDRVTVVDSETTRWKDWRVKMAGAEVLIFLGHGRADGNGAVLVLNAKEALSSRDFSQSLLIHTKLAVLSACSTGVGREEGLLDTENLVRSFLAAGVPRVLASEWNVDSETTAKLMKSFYFHLKQEKSVSRAMAHAKRDTLREMPHPYYWAAFNLIGRAD